MSNFTKLYLSYEIFRILAVKSQFLWNLTFIFLDLFFGVITDDLLHLKPLKNVKKNAIFFKLFWYKVFVHWKLKLLNFLVDSILMYGLSAKKLAIGR